MAHIKSMVLHGFKSFPKKTEIAFDQGINVILGPNGSGKSNISDGLCFVLGRLSIKSMRAAKAGNLIFMGSKLVKPAKEAYVDLIFDNNDRAFNMDVPEIHLKRIVRRNGQSIYKINDETKTRAEIIEMLAQAGIDPHGFNIILQGEIGSLVKVHPEERRKIIEEVAGISVYEARKDKSLKELEKTDIRLKEISTILRERTAYLNNLEKEKAQAERYKNLEIAVKRSKATILNRKISGKEKEVAEIIKGIDGKMDEKNKVKEKNDLLQVELEEAGEKISEINKHIQQATGLEQETLNNEIANLKAEIEGLRVRKENYETRKEEVEHRIEELESGIPEMESEIAELKKKSPKMAKKSEELGKKKQELGEIESERKRLLSVKTEVGALRERVSDKEAHLKSLEISGREIVKQVEALESGLEYKNGEECEKSVLDWREQISTGRGELDGLGEKEMNNEKIIVVCEAEIKEGERIKKEVENIDICPLCHREMTEKHREQVFSEARGKIDGANEKISGSRKELEGVRERKLIVKGEIDGIGEKIRNGEIEIERHSSIKDKKMQLRGILDNEKKLREEVKILEARLGDLENKSENIGKIEERYERKMMEIEEISSRTEEDLDTTVLYKQRELESVSNIIKRSSEDLGGIEEQISFLGGDLGEKEELLGEKEGQEEKLNARFKKLFSERDSLQKSTQEKNLELSEIRNEIRGVEEQINYLKIGKAKLDAEAESLQIELKEYGGVELLSGSLQVLEEKLEKSQNALQNIGSINMRALEVYDSVKEEYDRVYEKVETLEKEKEEVLKIIAEIDKKKSWTFMKTFKAINELFSQNFSKLSTKGTAYLELQNKEDIFSGGINIIVKLARGKYFDVSSLSGGEQTMVALALLFAVQEHKPYHFYIFDEIDAALDKRNSERLAGLLSQYMKSGQYIVITHNDAIITNSNVLYGVSMQEGVSKILSLKVE